MKFSKFLCRKYKVQVSSGLTIYSIAIKIFLLKFYIYNLGLINKTSSVYEDILLEVY